MLFNLFAHSLDVINRRVSEGAHSSLRERGDRVDGKNWYWDSPSISPSFSAKDFRDFAHDDVGIIRCCN